MVTRQLQVERRTGKVRRPETDVLPLNPSATQPTLLQWLKLTEIELLRYGTAKNDLWDRFISPVIVT